MKIDFKLYESKISEMLANNISIDAILDELKKHQVPPGICIMLLEKMLNLNYADASALVYKSKAYAELGKLNDLFLDKFTEEKPED